MRRRAPALLLLALVLGGAGWWGWPRTPAPQTCGLPPEALGAFVAAPGGSFVMSDGPVYPEEGEAMRVHVSPFLIQIHEVTNGEFARFVADTGYVTDAERERPGAGSATFVESATPADRASWWRLDRGATWRTPEGAGSDLRGREMHPVVHVSLNDARAYAAWAGARLPYEVEWEYAASLGLPDPDRPDSGAVGEDGTPRANIWNGVFPVFDSGADGHVGPAPVGCYAPGRLGAYDMIGNVWEWTETPFAGTARRTIKGGSFLCSDSFCRRFRPAAREAQDVDFSTEHIGIRLVRDVP